MTHEPHPNDTVPGGRLMQVEVRELIRLHRSGQCARAVARQLRISPNTERRYRRALCAAGLLDGEPKALPCPDSIRLGLLRQFQPGRPPQHRSSLEGWIDIVRALLAQGGTPTTIHAELTRRHGKPPGSLSAVKRLCLRIRRDPFT